MCASLCAFLLEGFLILGLYICHYHAIVYFDNYFLYTCVPGSSNFIELIVSISHEWYEPSACMLPHLFHLSSRNHQQDYVPSYLYQNQTPFLFHIFLVFGAAFILRTRDAAIHAILMVSDCCPVCYNYCNSDGVCPSLMVCVLQDMMSFLLAGCKMYLLSVV
jgi:hypothetical protein